MFFENGLVESYKQIHLRISGEIHLISVNLTFHIGFWHIKIIVELMEHTRLFSVYTRKMWMVSDFEVFWQKWILSGQTEFLLRYLVNRVRIVHKI